MSTVGVFGTVQSQWGNIQWGQLPAGAPPPSVGIFDLQPSALSMLVLKATAAPVLALEPSGDGILKLVATVELTP